MILQVRNKRVRTDRENTMIFMNRIAFMYSLTATSLVKPTRIASAVSAVLLAATMQSAMAQSNETTVLSMKDVKWKKEEMKIYKML